MKTKIAKSYLKTICFIFLLKISFTRKLMQSINTQVVKLDSTLKYSYPNWKKPLYSKRNNYSRNYAPGMNQHVMKINLYNPSQHYKILNIISKSKKENGLTCAINSLYKEISFKESFDHLNIEHNEKIIYSKLHSRQKILVYINDQIHIRIMDHIICLRLKYVMNPKGGCYQRFAYKNFSPTTIQNINGIRSEILVVTNNEVLTNYYLLIYIDKKIRIISI
jgi:hypothetical protein